MYRTATRRRKTPQQIKAMQEVQYVAEKAMKQVIVYIKEANHPKAEQAHAIINRVLTQYDCESPEWHIVSGGVHESPKIGRLSQNVLQEGDVVTIEPGLYYKTIGGIRIEDMIAITTDGLKNLTHFPKTFVL